MSEYSRTFALAIEKRVSTAPNKEGKVLIIKKFFLMEKNITTILKELNFSRTGRFEPSEIAKCIQSVENKDERRIIADAITGDHAKWLLHQMWLTPPSSGEGASFEDVARYILKHNYGNITPLIWHPLGAQSLARFCYDAADSDVKYFDDLPF